MSMASSPAVSAPLRHALAACVPDLQQRCTDPWVVIGSAATCLAGHALPVGDLDVLTSARDAQTLIDHWQDRRLPTEQAAGGDRFHSRFARFAFPGMPVEVMGDLEVRDGPQWRRVRVGDVQMARIDELVIPIPAEAEQVRLLRLFGRDKDLQRAMWLATRKKSA